MKLDAIQREFMVKALLLHLEVCTNKCTNHYVYRYLCNNHDKLNIVYDEIPFNFGKKSLNKNKLKFLKAVSYSDGTTGVLASYKVSLCYGDYEYLLGNTFVDLTIKELTTLQRPITKQKLCSLQSSPTVCRLKKRVGDLEKPVCSQSWRQQPVFDQGQLKNQWCTMDGTPTKYLC